MTPTACRQERPALLPGAQLLLLTLGPTAAVHGQIAAQFQRPMRVQVVHDPVETLDVRELDDHVPDMTHEIPSATPGGDTADDLTCGHDQTADQTTGAVTLVFKLPSLDPTGARTPGRMQTLQRLDAGLLIDRHHQLVLPVHGQS